MSIEDDIKAYRKQKRKEYAHRYYLEHREELYASHREYNQRNREKMLAYHKEYNAKYRAKLREQKLARELEDKNIDRGDEK